MDTSRISWKVVIRNNAPSDRCHIRTLHSRDSSNPTRCRGETVKAIKEISDDRVADTEGLDRTEGSRWTHQE
jgi:hypothetical protein